MSAKPNILGASSTQITSQTGDRVVDVNFDMYRYVLREPNVSVAELHAFIDEYEKTRFAIFLENLSGPSPFDEKLVGGWGNPPHGEWTEFKNTLFHARAVAETLEVKKKTYIELYPLLQTMTLEDQRSVLKSLARTVSLNDKTRVTSYGRTHILPYDMHSRLEELDDSHAFLREMILRSMALKSAISLMKSTQNPYIDDVLKYDRNKDVNTRLAEFVRFLSSNNLLLLPVIQHQRLIGILRRSTDDAYLSQERRQFLSQVKGAYSLRASRSSFIPVLRVAKLLTLCTTLVSVEDLSPDLCLNFEEAFYRRTELESKGLKKETKFLTEEKAYFRRTVDVFIKLWSQQHPGEAFPHKFLVEARVGARYDGTRTANFDWIATRNPSLFQWSKFLEQYTGETGRKIKLIKPVRTRLNHWGDYLLSLKGPPVLPEDTRRDIHITGSAKSTDGGYLAFLESDVESIHQRNGCLNELDRFFDWYLYALHGGRVTAHPNFVNPIFIDLDKWTEPTSEGITHRKVLKADVMDLLKRIITSDDFAFCRDPSRFATDNVWVVDHETREMVEVWFPGRALALHLLLDLPLRGFQTRWMDTGEADEFTVLMPAIPGEKPKIVKNSHPNAVKGRQFGPFRLTDDGEDTIHIGLYVPTNKTADMRAQGKTHGHTFPWVPDSVIETVIMMQRWQARYGFQLNEPVEAIDQDMRIERDYLHKVKVFPLFRDPTRTDKHMPVTRNRLQFMFRETLLEADRIQQSVSAFPKPLIKKTGKNTYETDYDLHSLRVSGITNLLEADVPLEIVSRFMAGHHSLIMTLWYDKIDLKRVRDTLRRAHDRLATDELSLKELLLQKTDGKVFLPKPNIMLERDPNWRVMIDGICPGASCAEGALDDFGDPIPVPDTRCSLCRFNLTGPRFIAGQVVLMSEILRRVHSREAQLRTLRDQHNKLLAAVNGGVPSQGDLNLLEGQMSKLSELQRLDLLDLAARKERLEASRKLLADGRDKALVTKGDKAVMEAHMGTGLHIENLHLLGLAAEVIPGYSNPDAVRELQQLLEDILARNGCLISLANLSDHERLRAVNLMADTLMESVATQQELLGVLEGEISLESIILPSNQTVADIFRAIAQRIDDSRPLPVFGSPIGRRHLNDKKVGADHE